jgi:hypothetical protein
MLRWLMFKETSEKISCPIDPIENLRVSEMLHPSMADWWNEADELKHDLLCGLIMRLC